MAAVVPAPAGQALRFDDVDVVRGQNLVLHGVSWQVDARQRWVVLGPNGSGKTTMLQLASGYLHPTRGTVAVLGHQLGRVDVRRLRERIGLVSAAVAKLLVPSVSAADVVMSARYAALDPWWHDYSAADRQQARHLLDRAGFAGVADRPFGVLSEGERQQVLLARTLMGDPDLLLLDEPAAGLDIAGRERLLTRLAELAAEPASPPMVLVTHHVEEVPAHFSHLLLLRQGAVVAAGPLAETMTSDHLSATYGLALTVDGAGGRWTCRAAS
ncbi:MAG TPA: ATP-binding cassette domain-containing protein [Acidimicrobiales bacterium]|jgi:iron complex transport system ATP-binding protein|nr:ATP-binding cassette domain-containing protein [Acidimicrobiales bacterium]